MANRRKTVSPINVAPQEPDDSASRQNTPLIQISHLNVQEAGITNPVFTFEGEELTSKSSPNIKALAGDDANGGQSLRARRGSAYGPTRKNADTSGLLAVPHTVAGPRRHSLGSVSTKNDPNLRPQSSVSIDRLSSPWIPQSPGTVSMRSMWSSLTSITAKHSSVSTNEEQDQDPKRSISGMSTQMSDRIRHLVHQFMTRTERFKEKTIQPPTPSTENKSAVSGVSNGDLDAPVRQHRLDSFIPLSSRNSNADADLKEERYIGWGRCRIKSPKWLERLKFPNTIDPQSKLYLSWLFVVTFAFLYNAWMITLRAAFHIYQTDENLKFWWFFDYFFDLIYILDIVVFKARLCFLRSGLLEKDRKETMKNYMKKRDFKLDMVCLVPLDILYLIPSLNYNPLVRLPRLLKILTFWEFFDRMDQAASSGHIIRIIKTMTYMSYLIHLETCGYYAMSRYQGIASDEWVYSGKGVAYIRCLYLATKTATSIGKNPSPTNEQQWIFMTVYWLSGVFVFALLIGQIRDIFQSAGAIKNSYRKTLDQTIWYMESLNLPKELQDRVRLWLTYNWEQQKTLNENSLLDGLPKKMRTDLAINVHYHTLSKVQLFQDCDKNLLFDLVLKLKPVLYLPMDMICRKGEVGIEMYIVVAGQVEVVGGPDNNTVLATLSQGSVFGEISLLALAGGNRRTADVRSKGFSNLFILNKWDFEEAMRDYPEAQSLLKKRAKRLLAQNAKQVVKDKKIEAEEIIKSRQGTPKLLKTVIQVVEPDSHIHQYLGFKNAARKHTKNQGKNSKSLPKNGLRTGEYDRSSSGEGGSEHMDDLFDDEPDEILIVEQTEHEIRRDLPSSTDSKQPPAGDQATDSLPDFISDTGTDQDLADILGSQVNLSSMLDVNRNAATGVNKHNKTESSANNKNNAKVSPSQDDASNNANNQPVNKHISNVIASDNTEPISASKSNTSKPSSAGTSKSVDSASSSGIKSSSNPSSAGGKKSKSASPTAIKLMNNKVAPEGKAMSNTDSRTCSPLSDDVGKSSSCPPLMISGKTTTPPISATKKPSPGVATSNQIKTTPPPPSTNVSKAHKPQNATVEPISKSQGKIGSQLKKTQTTPNMFTKKISLPSNPQPKKTHTPPTAQVKKTTVVPAKKTSLPSGVQMKKLDLQIPPENKVTADVIVHREKGNTSSSAARTTAVSNKKHGVDNPAFVSFSNGQTSHVKKDVNETEL